METLRTIFVTGSRGFIGRNVVEFFKNSYNILAPSHDELNLLSQENVDKFFRENKIDYVIHCANIGGNRKAEDGPEVVERNLRMFFNLSKNKKHFKKMIHFGSGAEYSKDVMPPMVKESDFDKAIPQDYYGFSKYIISKYIENTDNIYCLRLFGVFGPYEDYAYKFISNSILKNILQMPIKIMQNVYFDWLYVEDLMNLISHFLINNPCNHVYNVTTGKTTDLISIAKIINNLSDFKSEIIIVNEGLNKEYSGNNQLLMDELKNYEFMDMEKSIKKLFKYYTSNLDNLNLEIVRKDPYTARCKINESKRS